MSRSVFFWILLFVAILLLASNELFFYGLLLGVSFMIGGSLGLSPRALFGPWPSREDWKFTARWGVPLLIGVYGLSTLFLLGAYWISPRLIESMLKLQAQMEKGSFLVLALFLSPLCEELFLRRALFQLIARKFDVRKAIWVTAFIFGILHIDPLGTVTLGLIQGILVTRTRSVWIPLLFHLITNAVVVVPFVMTAGASTMTPDSTDLWVGLACTGISLPFLWKFLKQLPQS